MKYVEDIIYLAYFVMLVGIEVALFELVDVFLQKSDFF